jgi:tol-pal system protein YbgF
MPFFFLVFLVAGCATGADPMMQDVEFLKREVFDMKKQISAVSGDVDTLKKTSAGMESFTAVRESQTEINSRLSDISMGLQELRGRFEENKYYQEKILREAATDRDLLRVQISGIEAQLRALRERLGYEQSAAPGSFPSPPPSGAMSSPGMQPGQGEAVPGSGETAATGEAVADERLKSYETAYQLFRENKYSEARSRFEAFIRDYPPNDLTDNAQFWISETYYAEKDYESAILAYETVLKKYPESDKTAGSLLKQGYAFIEIGDTKTGRIILQKLIERFPDSQEAASAKKKISDLEKKPAR